MAPLAAAEWNFQLGELRAARPTSASSAGRLVQSLERQDRLSAAAQTLDRIQKAYPQVQITQHGAPLAADSLSAAIAHRLATLERPARVGSTISREVRAPRRLGARQPAHARPPAPRRARRRCSRPPPDASASGAAGIESGKLQLAWTREAANEPTLVRLDASRAAYFFGPALRRASSRKSAPSAARLNGPRSPSAPCWARPAAT